MWLKSPYISGHLPLNHSSKVTETSAFFIQLDSNSFLLSNFLWSAHLYFRKWKIIIAMTFEEFSINWKFSRADSISSPAYGIIHGFYGEFPIISKNSANLTSRKNVGYQYWCFFQVSFQTSIHIFGFKSNISVVCMVTEWW